MLTLTRSRTTVLLVLACLWTGLAAGSERPKQGFWFENDRLRIVLVPRTAEQMAAFYEARGFPSAALDRLRQTCFITVHIENRGEEILWLELEHWNFNAGGKPLERLDAKYWQSQWEAIGLPQAKRSTFGWTQLPAVRDLRHDESVGGNVVLPGDTGTVDISAVFHTGADQQGETIRLGFGRIPCPGEAP